MHAGERGIFLKHGRSSSYFHFSRTPLCSNKKHLLVKFAGPDCFLPTQGDPHWGSRRGCLGEETELLCEMLENAESLWLRALLQTPALAGEVSEGADPPLRQLYVLLM